MRLTLGLALHYFVSVFCICILYLWRMIFSENR